jgi:hypothetical protein
VRLGLGCCITAAALLLVGCGGGKKGPPDNGVSDMTAAGALTAVKKAIAGARSVHVSGSGRSGGSPVKLDLKLVKGQGGAGHFGVGGLEFDVVRIGDKAFFKGDKRFWANFVPSAAVQQLLADRWIRAPANTGDLAQLTPVTDLVQLLDQTIDAPGKLVMGDETEVDGQKAVAITDEANGGTLYVATTGPAYPLKLAAGKGKTGTIDFTDWNQPVLLSPPAKSIDYGKLTGG